ncbi:MAG: hypothetical protein O3B22_19105 [Proteobacteria bacterium]|nr:hypothetical protein [Pseudomonadota bacterium]MDA0952705.1 hypothetical protein [Pseudomonadota bacterium]
MTLGVGVYAAPPAMGWKLPVRLGVVPLVALAAALGAALAADGRNILANADPGSSLRLRFGLTATAVLCLLAVVTFG